MKQSEQGLGSAECHITSLKDAQERLQTELDVTRERLTETSDSLFAVQVNLEMVSHNLYCIEQCLYLDKASREDHFCSFQTL